MGIFALELRYVELIGAGTSSPARVVAFLMCLIWFANMHRKDMKPQKLTKHKIKVLNCIFCEAWVFCARTALANDEQHKTHKR
ncbi:hypothetical protein POVCU2_0027060 [Plasmodium ovale curtisi]|uniref:Uncharacterized protein n=1 Tax=Plasmodium ovale curtisi TaxID=864141 RepID=A0A1A8W0F5_PLAOA|nr:hypothetical protein POVCU2_0027060 [Plasmodium ovale curtisi]SBS93148.1 hypothetical protein POVCU1_024790 [Plasmodium ovale curtisi]